MSVSSDAVTGRLRAVALVLACLLGGLAPCRLQAQNITLAPVITTVAGNGSYSYSGDNGPATIAGLYIPLGVAVDSAGNLYIADLSNNRIRKVDTSGTITTVAGGGSGCPGQTDSVGDGCPATSAALNDPAGVAVDSAGNLYIAEENNRIRKVDASGTITTVAGNGTAGYSGDGGPATSAKLSYPYGVAVDRAGNLYIADVYNNRVRKVDASGIITTVAGNGTGGYSGDGGPAISAELYPQGVAVDSAGNLYIGDSNNLIRKVDASGVITTVAGNGTPGYSGDNGPATSAQLYDPYGVAVDSAGNLYIADQRNQRIRKVDASGTITTVAGDGTEGYGGDNGPATSAELDYPHGVAVDSAGNLYIADAFNNRIRKVTKGPVNFGRVNVDANSTQNVFLSINTALTLSAVQTSGDYSVTSDSCDPLPAALSASTVCTLQVQFTPTKPGQRWFPLVVTDINSNKYSFGLEGTGVGPALAFTPGIITTVAGGGSGCFGQTDSVGDGCPATSAEITYPLGLAVDSAGNLYIADEANYRIRKVDASGFITKVAGNGTPGYSGDGGPATSAGLNLPFGVAVDSAGNLYIADRDNYRIRKVDASGIITTVAGNGSYGYNGDNIAATSAELRRPEGVAVDSAGNVYIADTFNFRIRKVDASGTITTVAGKGTRGYSGDGGPATSAELYTPAGVAVDSARNLYIADSNSSRVRKVDASGTITTVAGNGSFGYNGDNIAAASAELSFPLAVAVDSAGNLYIADQGNNRIRKVDASGTITTVAGNGTQGYSGDNGPATSAELSGPPGVAVDSAGNLYIADFGNSRIRKVDVTTAALSFSSLSVGQTSSAQSVAVSDVGNAALNFSSLLASSNFLLQGVGNDCVAGTPLAVGATCALGVAFAPTMAGNPLTGALTVSDDAFNTPQSVGLSGIATQAPTVSFTGAPASAPYGGTFNVAATTNASTTAVITAGGACSVAGTMVTMTAGTGTCSLTANWAADANYIAASLGQSTTGTKAGSATSITSNSPNPSTTGQAAAVGFKVTGAAGVPTGSVMVMASTGESCNAALSAGAGSCPLTFNTSGSRTLTAAYAGDGNFDVSSSAGVSQSVIGPQAMVTPSSIDFGTVYLGAIITRNVTVTNIGNAPMKITGPLFSIVHGGNSNEFFAVNLCPKSLAAGKSCTITVGFAAGPYYTPQTATLSVVDNAPGSPQTVALSATVINPQATLSASSLSFGTQKVNTSSAAKAVRLKNTGATALAITSIGITGKNPLDFMQTNDCPDSLAANASCTISVTFKPTAKGSRSGSVVITDNARNGPQKMSLSGTGN
ncbi:MAG: choice-of-anchor D domain-containing protein [Terriglobales bacterium]